MGKKDLKRQQKRINALSQKWRTRLFLDEWHVEHVWRNGPVIIDGKEDHEALAVVSTLWPYRRASIQWNLPAVAMHDDAELEHAFIHECMHILLEETRLDGHEHNEHTAETLAYVIQRVEAMSGG